MPRKTTTTKPVASAKPSKPVASGTPGQQPAAINAAAKRSNVLKPVASKPAKRTSKPASDATPSVAKPSANVTRTAATIAAQRTNFGGLTDRDNAYIRFYAGLAKRGNGTVTVADIVASGSGPDYAGSAKPHDAGVIVRLGKANVLASNADGSSFTFTKHGQSLSAYTSAR